MSDRNQGRPKAPLGTQFYSVPAGTPASKCKWCGRAIYWIVTKNKKNMPVGADGRFHKCQSFKGKK